LEDRARQPLAGQAALLAGRCRHVGVAQEHVTIQLGRRRQQPEGGQAEHGLARAGLAH
jgi:hypothetical protein